MTKKPPSGPLQRPSGKIVEALQRAFMALQADNLSEAEASFKKVLSKDASQFDALHMLAVINAQRGNYAEGIRLLSKALVVNPDFAEAHINLGRMQAECRDYSAAVESYRRAIRLNPRLPLAHSNFSAILLNLGHREEALSHTQAAVTMAPNYADAWHNRGNVLIEMGRFDEARASYERAFACDPTNVDAAMGRALVFQSTGKYVDAVAAFDRVLQLRPDQPYACGHRLYSKMHICEWSNYEADTGRLISKVRKGPSVAVPFALVALSSSAADQLKCAADYVHEKFPASVNPLAAGKNYGHGKIRLAYLSADFHDHATANLMAGVFEQHNRSHFEIVAVSFGPDSTSNMRKRLADAFDRFIDVRLQSDQAIAQAIRDLEIDIAVDLKGFTKDCRPGVLARRPAPIQVNYLGYPGTMGAPYIDYIIADRVVIPAADQQFYAEKVVCLPGSYQPNDDRRVRPALGMARSDEGLPEQGFVFCSFNNTYKLTPAIFDIWMRLLRQIDGSVLWLLEGNEVALQNLRREAERRGVPASRLVFAKRIAFDEHLSRHRLADLFLDTLPCNAHTTASDALWMGLPVLTCAGTTFAGRVAASLLSAAGLEELIAPSLADYESMALKFARDQSLLNAFRERVEFSRSGPLFNTKLSTRHIEAAYAHMCERFQRGERPTGFGVESLAGLNAVSAIRPERKPVLRA
jgi:predicted O-linked N-acetylglucosamine transferase (SPINDLY family)